TAGSFRRRGGRAVEVPGVFDAPGVEPRLDVAEAAARDHQLRLHAGHVAEDFRRNLPAELLGDAATQAHVVVAPDTDGARPFEQGDNLGGPAHGTECVTGIAEGNDQIHLTAAELGQRPLQRLDGLMDTCDGTSAPRFTCRRDGLAGLPTTPSHATGGLTAGKHDGSWRFAFIKPKGAFRKKTGYFPRLKGRATAKRFSSVRTVCDLVFPKVPRILPITC